MKAAVVALPRNDGRNVRGPTARLTTAATPLNTLARLLAGRDPALRTRLTEQPKIADMTASHLSYPAVSTAVASGVMPLLDGARFQVNRVVTGAEALETVARLRALAR